MHWIERQCLEARSWRLLDEATVGEVVSAKAAGSDSEGPGVHPASTCRCTFSVARPLAQSARGNTAMVHGHHGAMATCSAQPRPYVVREALEALRRPNRR